MGNISTVAISIHLMITIIIVSSDCVVFNEGAMDTPFFQLRARLRRSSRLNLAMTREELDWTDLASGRWAPQWQRRLLASR
jgi:hypothetical protein